MSRSTELAGVCVCVCVCTHINACVCLCSGSASQEPDFYKTKIATSAFVFDNILPRTESLKTTMFTPISSIMGLKEDKFSFDL